MHLAGSHATEKVGGRKYLNCGKPRFKKNLRKIEDEGKGKV